MKVEYDPETPPPAYQSAKLANDLAKDFTLDKEVVDSGDSQKLAEDTHGYNDKQTTWESVEVCDFFGDDANDFLKKSDADD